LIISLGVFLFIISPILSHRFEGAYKLPIGAGLESLAIMLLLFWCIKISSKVADFLNCKIISHIGVLSYSLYIWQQLFLNNKINYWFNQFPQNILLVFVVAHVSYYFIEMPFLNLKKRFIKPELPLHKERAVALLEV
jgi:peptidoglycan/LPS O-acetylase OafA/YrhL